MATTTNFGWETPDDTDLVKDGAAAIRTALGGVDTSFVDLKGGTSGQVLSKASNTDLDFTWVAQDDSNAIQNAIVDAKGDLIAATAADTPARLAVGTNGQVLTADSTTATGLAWATASGGGGMTSIASGTLSGSSVVLSSISGSYKDLQLVIRGLTLNTSDSYLTLKVNAITTGYNAAWALSYQDTGYTGGNSNESIWRVAQDAAQLRTNDQNIYVFNFYDYASTNDTKLAGGWWHMYSGDLRAYTASLSVIGVDTAITTLTIGNNAGNTFSGGTYELFGVK